MNLKSIELLRELENELLKESADQLNRIEAKIEKLAFQDRDSYTLKEVEDRTGIGRTSLDGYRKKGILTVRVVDKGKMIVLKNDLLDFLNNLPRK